MENPLLRLKSLQATTMIFIPQLCSSSAQFL
jgi:hypothetical protein